MTPFFNCLPKFLFCHLCHQSSVIRSTVIDVSVTEPVCDFTTCFLCTIAVLELCKVKTECKESEMKLKLKLQLEMETIRSMKFKSHYVLLLVRIRSM